MQQPLVHSERSKTDTDGFGENLKNNLMADPDSGSMACWFRMYGRNHSKRKQLYKSWIKIKKMNGAYHY